MGYKPSPKVSIVLPTYNGVQYLKQSIESCLKQTHNNIELIIVDDASIDTTAQIIQEYNDSRLRYIRQDVNVGIAAALNRGFSKAHGEYLTWTSDDNYYVPGAIKCMLRVLESNKRVDFVYANFYKVDEKGNIVFERRVGTPIQLNIENCVGACFLYKRKVYETIGQYSPEALLAEDYDYWLRVRERFKMKRINKFLYYYRIHSSSLSSKYVNEEIEALLEKIRDKHISPAMEKYLAVHKHFVKKDYIRAKKSLRQCFWSNFFNRDAWRLLFILYLPPSITQVIRNSKRKIERMGKH